MFGSIRVRYLLLFVLCCALKFPAHAQHPLKPPDTEATRADDAAAQANPQRPLEVVFCLDVSGSMLGQKGQAVDWILDTLHAWYLKREVRVGLVTYYDPGSSWVVPFNSDATEVEKALTLSQGGAFGDETVGTFINVALDHDIYQWTPDNSVEKRIVVVGNEHMNIGPNGVSYENATLNAASNGWHIDAIEGYSRPDWTFMITPKLNQWQHMALIGRGVYSSFIGSGNAANASNYRASDVRAAQNYAPETTPFDQQLRSLNEQWNQTIIPVGRVASNNWRAVMEEERELDRIGALYAVLLSKITARHPDWELIDGWQTNAIDVTKVPPSQLPTLWRMTDPKMLLQSLKTTLGIRIRAQQAIATLLQQRALWLQQQRVAQIDAARARFQLALQQLQQQQQTQAANSLPVSEQMPAPDAAPHLLRERATNAAANANAPDFAAERPALPAPLESASWPATSRSERPNGGTKALEETRVLDEGGTMNEVEAAENDLAELSDEFTSSASLPRWQRDEAKAGNFNAPRVDDGLRLQNSGTLFKSVSGDFAVTLSLKIELGTTKASDNKTTANDFALALRLPPATTKTQTDLSQFALPTDEKLTQVAWRMALSGEKAVPRLEPKATQDAFAPAELKKTDEIRVRLARLGSKIVALQEVAGQWQLCGRFDISGWPKDVQLALLSPTHDTTQVLAVHFQRLKAKTFPASPAQWLQLVGDGLGR